MVIGDSKVSITIIMKEQCVIGEIKPQFPDISL